VVPFNEADPDQPRIRIGDGFAQWFVQEKQPADNYYDFTFSATAGGATVIAQQSKFDKEVNAAIQSFKSANNNTAPSAPSQLAPYLQSAIDPGFIQRRLGNKQ
jgi:hypothetical protein